MFLIFLIIAEAADEKVYFKDEDSTELFENFIRNYNKEYEYQEKVKRFDIFKDNLKQINRLNSMDDAIFGINDFTDLTAEEMRNTYMGLVEPDGYFNLTGSCKQLTADSTEFHAPDSLDYRQKNAVTQVKHQRRCNSCWIFASIGTIEGSYAIKHGKLLSFSEQQLLDCLKCSRGCAQGGFMVNALSELTNKHGVMLESEYPYIGRDQRCKFDDTRVEVKVTGCLNYRLRNENQLKEFLFRHGPISIAINGGASQYYKRGILSKKSCPSNSLNHAVLLVGYGTENGKDYWIIKNSYGEKFGESGYIRITRGENTCGLVNNMAASAEVA